MQIHKYHRLALGGTILAVLLISYAFDFMAMSSLPELTTHSKYAFQQHRFEVTKPTL